MKLGEYLGCKGVKKVEKRECTRNIFNPLITYIQQLYTFTCQRYKNLKQKRILNRYKVI